jgi:hypothetical protein
MLCKCKVCGKTMEITLLNATLKLKNFLEYNRMKERDYCKYGCLFEPVDKIKNEVE